MAFKFLFVIGFVAVASAGYVPAAQVYHTAPVSVHSAPVAVAEKLVANSEEYDPHPQYKYSYGVEDSVTGDSKSHVEERDGDVVRGEYSLIDADGYKRTVQYTADAHNGFNAVVRREPLIKAAHYAAPAVVKTVAPVVHYAAPVVAKTHYTAPAAIRTVAPVAHFTNPAVAPVAHYTAPTVATNVVPVAHYSARNIVPVPHYAAPTVTQYLAPAVTNSAPAHFTSYASPVVSYHH